MADLTPQQQAFQKSFAGLYFDPATNTYNSKSPAELQQNKVTQGMIGMGLDADTVAKLSSALTPAQMQGLYQAGSSGTGYNTLRQDIAPYWVRNAAGDTEDLSGASAGYKNTLTGEATTVPEFYKNQNIGRWGSGLAGAISGTLPGIVGTAAGFMTGGPVGAVAAGAQQGLNYTGNSGIPGGSAIGTGASLYSGNYLGAALGGLNLYNKLTAPNPQQQVLQQRQQTQQPQPQQVQGNQQSTVLAALKARLQQGMAQQQAKQGMARSLLSRILGARQQQAGA